jgi:hypothetical protein
MARQSARVQPCGVREAQNRWSQAQKFLEVAEIAAGEHGQDPEYASVAVSLAVLSGIAAADAACCKALGERSRSQSHRDAEGLLRNVAGGEAVAKDLRALIALKDEAQYGFFNVNTEELKRALRRTRSLLGFAEEVLRR